MRGAGKGKSSARPGRGPGKVFWCAVAIVAAAAAVYIPGLGGDFVFDDEYTVLANPHIKRLWPPREALAAPPRSPLRDRPVVSLTFSISYALGGLEREGWRLFNLAVHIASALMLFILLRWTLENRAMPSRFREAAAGLAAAIALLWTVHPLQTAAVSYITQRCESLAGFFYLAVVCCAVKSSQSRHPGAWFAAAIAGSAMGMGTKAMMVTVPFMVLIYDRLFLASSWKDLWRRRRGLYIGLALTWLVLAYLLVVTSYPDIKTHRWWEYVLSQPRVIVHYLRLVFYPRPLVLDYGWPVARSAVEIIPSLLLVGFLFAVTVWGLVKGSPWSISGAWFFLVLAPTSSVFPLEDLAFEHRMYLPLAAVIGVVTSLGWNLFLRFSPDKEMIRRRVLTAAVVIIAVVLGCLTVERNRDYESSEKIWSANILVRPLNPRGYNFLANSLLRRGKEEEAEKIYRSALKVEPGYSPGHYNLGNLLAGRGDLEEAVYHYRLAVRFRPESVEALNNLGVALVKLGKTEEGIEVWKRSIRIDPSDPAAYFNLAQTLAAMGRIEEAEENAARTIKLKPDFSPARELLWRLRRPRTDSLQPVMEKPMMPEAGVEPARGVSPTGF